MQSSPFAFKVKEVSVKVAGGGPPVELLIPMEPVEGRGQIIGKAVLTKPPLAPPKR
ncbi:hypothetical protein LGH70_18445 [Hymenobacter sp. BT635]|uniref:Uncharacterized protein n=1 Tax=Hymenobacter nitidus TaxID=2880929 RepID=A0ABS8AHW8_9BACT|nr:hypothetical protein [Hymenobacter nitidus]MCB2379582.1 hypothetical protein [Hymenobacter nitidus]